jgi:hypothetical protein
MDFPAHPRTLGQRWGSVRDQTHQGCIPRSCPRATGRMAAPVTSGCARHHSQEGSVYPRVRPGYRPLLDRRARVLPLRRTSYKQPWGAPAYQFDRKRTMDAVERISLFRQEAFSRWKVRPPYLASSPVTQADGRHEALSRRIRWHVLMMGAADNQR